MMASPLRTLLLPCLLLPCLLAAQVPMPATSLVGMAEIERLAQAIPDPARLTSATEGSFPTALIGGRCMVGFLGRVSGQLPPSDATLLVGARIGDIVSFRVDATALHRVRQLPGLDYAELAGKVVPHLDKARWSTRVDSVHAGIQLPQAYSGQGVLIGITDWGFDYTHPMFLDTGMTTYRIRAAWDHYRQAGPPPAGFGYGTELATTAALLAAGSDTANIYSYSTHGTHVAGIAGGGGAGTEQYGMAFGAEFLFNTFLVDAAAVIDAFAWMKNIADADQKRLVVNMSWGLYHMGTLDGTSLVSQAIDQLSAQGVVFVTSAGNNGSISFHLRKEFAGDVLRSRVQFYPYDAHPNMWGQSIHLWGEPGNSFSAGFEVTSSGWTTLVETPWYHTATQPGYLDSMLVHGNDTIQFNLTADAAHPLNGRPHFRLRIRNTNTQLNIVLRVTAENGTVHAWNVTELTNDVGNWGQAFLGGQSGLTVGDRAYGIGEPACTESAIAVAAYSSENVSPSGAVSGGAIAGFSSFGPTLDERLKPDLAAPGLSVLSSISSFTDASFSPSFTVEYEGTTYPFARFSGTSMSSPAVAGIAALLLEADPELSPADLRTLLRSTTRTDGQTGVIPPEGSTRWGMGKVNAYRAIADLLGVTGTAELAGHAPSIWPNPARDVLHVLPAGPDRPSRITIRDATGRLVYEGRHVPGLAVVPVQALARGLFLLEVAQDGRSGYTRFVVQ